MCVFFLNNGREHAYFPEAGPPVTVTFSVEQKEKSVPSSSVGLLIERLPHCALDRVSAGFKMLNKTQALLSQSFQSAEETDKQNVTRECEKLSPNSALALGLCFIFSRVAGLSWTAGTLVTQVLVPSRPVTIPSLWSLRKQGEEERVSIP